MAVSTYGINGPFPEGHFGASAALGTVGRNMWRWKTVFPIAVVLDRPPTPANYYMHHPMGTFWMIAVLGKLLGFSNWVLRLPPLIYVTVTPFLLFKIGRALWSPIPAGLTALGYVALPITLGYANYHDLEQPVMLGCVLSTWGYLRFVRTGRDRYAVASVLGLLFAVNHDWPGYLWAAPFLAGVFVYGFLIPARLRARPVSDATPDATPAFGRYWALMAIALAASFALELALVVSSGRISDVLGSYAARSSGSEVPLSAVLTARHYRINLMFTGLGIVLGKLALPIVLVRAAIRRDHLELLSLPLLFCATVQYVFFKQGADVHIFWPHYFAAYFALAIGALAASASDGMAWIGARLRGEAGRAMASRWAPWAGLIVGVPLALVLKDGLSLVRLSRETGGRFAEANRDAALDVQAALRWFLARYPLSMGIGYHPGVPDSWSMQWENRGRPSAADQPVAGAVTAKTQLYVMDTRAASGADLRSAASRFHVHAVGPIWLCDRAEAPAPLDGYAMDEREPSFWERWSQGPTEPIRSIRFSPWATWQWRTLIGQPARPPTGIPATDDEIRIAYNVAIEAGDATGAGRWRSALAARFNLKLAAQYQGGTVLIGGRENRGAQRSATLFFVAGAMSGDDRFAIHAKVTAPPHWSTLPVDPLNLETPGGPDCPTSLWRRGQIYSVEIVIRKRPGTETWSGAWTPGPGRTDGPAELQILQL